MGRFDPQPLVPSRPNNEPDTLSEADAKMLIQAIEDVERCEAEEAERRSSGGKEPN